MKKVNSKLKIILAILGIGIAILFLPITILGIGIYSIFYTVRNNKKIREKYNLKINPIFIGVLIFILSFPVAGKSIEILYNSDNTKQPAQHEEKVVKEKKKEDKKQVDKKKQEDKKKEEQKVKKNEDQKKKQVKKEKVPSNTFAEAKVTKVVDGDTIYVNLENKEYKIRMIGVDTPETVHPSKPVQFYGREASDFTKSSLSNRTVYLQKDVSETDKYGRLLRYVWLSRPETNEPTEKEIIDKMYNAKLIKGGYAQAYTYQPDSKYSELFVKLQKEARENYVGLWNETKAREFEQQANGSQGNDNNNSSTKSGTGDETAFGKEYNADTTQGVIKGNRNSMIYHVPGGASYNKISENNVVYFNSEEEAQAAGYRRAKR